MNVLHHGAVCNGHHDDTLGFRRAIDKAPTGGAVYVPAGKCVVSDTIVIDASHPVSIAGTGRGSQIFQRTSSKTLLQLQGVNGVSVKDLYLGSAATLPGTSLLKLTNSHHNRIDNISMLGGYYGLHLQGSLLNTIVDLRSGTNFAGFFAATSANQYWVYAERFNNISANANTFVAPVLEGGVNGLWLVDAGGEGSLTSTGGTIEGVSGVALKLDQTFLPTSITGMHFEANGVADVIVQDSSNIRFSAILSLNGINLNGDTRNVQVSDSIVEQMLITATTKRIQLQNITSQIATCTNNIVNQNPNTIIVNLGFYCVGQ